MMMPIQQVAETVECGEAEWGCWVEHWFHHGAGILGPKVMMWTVISGAVLYFIVRPVALALVKRRNGGD